MTATLGAFVRDMVHQRGLSMSWLARQMGVTPGRMYFLVRTPTEGIKLGTVQRIARALGFKKASDLLVLYEMNQMGRLRVDPDRKRLSPKPLQIIRERKLSVNALSKLLDIPRTTLRYYLIGHIRAPRRVREKIAAVLGLRLNEVTSD